MVVYLTEPGCIMRKDGGKFIVQKGDDVLSEIPSAKIEAVVIARGSHVTSNVCEDLLDRGVPVTYIDYTGRFKGRLEPAVHYNIERMALQFDRYYDEPFCLGISKKIIFGKLANSKVVLRRYNRNACDSRVKKIINEIDAYEADIGYSKNIQQLLGYEGIFSKLYFEGLSCLVCDEAKFIGRSKRPPKDPFNSLLSFGYSLLLNEIYTSITHKGLNPYIGVMHRIRNGHPALASDLMEEWRPLMVDSMVLKLINGSTFKVVDFKVDSRTGGVYLNRDDSKKFIEHFETRLLKTNKYIDDIASPMTFRETLQYQINLFVKAIEEKNPDLYSAVVIR